MKYFGIDPGSYKLGWAILEQNMLKDSKNDLAIDYIDSGNLIISEKEKYIGTRLEIISEAISNIAHKHYLVPASTTMILEDYFVKSYKGAKIISQVQGVLILAAGEISDEEVKFITPTSVKKAICGDGRATKEQIKQKIIKLLNIPKKKVLSDDESDALAITCAWITKNQNQRVLLV